MTARVGGFLVSKEHRKSLKSNNYRKPGATQVSGLPVVSETQRNLAKLMSVPEPGPHIRSSFTRGVG